MTSRATALPVAIVAATYGLVGPSLPLAVVLVLFAAGSAAAPSRLALDRMAQVLVLLLMIAAGIALGTTVFAPATNVPVGFLRLGWSVSVLALLLVCIGRLWTARPLGGDPTTIVVALVALAACGGTDSGAIYPVAVASFLVAAAWARRRSDPARGPWSLQARRPLGALALALVLTVAAVAAAREALPPLHGWVVAQILRSGRLRTGFTTRMSLGSLVGLWESDEVVLRLRGADADYLRGAVFATYLNGRWAFPDDQTGSRIDLPAALGPSRGVTSVELVSSDPEHYFLPLEATEAAVSTEVAVLDPDGLLTPLAAAPSQLYSFRSHAQATRQARLPEAADLAVHPELGGALTALARAWARNATTPLEKLDALARRLRLDYRYSLDVPHPAGDPVLHFLLRSRQGHCEYFASAFALLARTLDVPTRVVAGYRAVETSELGGYTIVRERHAHAWVEAWIDGRWQTFDPTPPDAAAVPAPTTTPWAAALLDLARAKWAATLRWLDRRTPLEIAAALGLLVLLALVVRGARALYERRRAAPSAGVDEPPSWLGPLVRQLERHGVCRVAHEPIEALARRCEDRRLGAELAESVRAFVASYAAFRYGGLGDGAALERESGRLAHRLSLLALPSAVSKTASS